MTRAHWQDHFTSALQNAESLYSKETTTVSLLMFCLRSKLIPGIEYLEWAKENFQLPVISEKYFQVHKPKAELFKKWQKAYKWSNECLPIAEWDGVLIIACLEIPENYDNANPTSFVLASHEVLDQTWNTYNKSERVSSAPMGIDLADMTALAATVVAPAAKIPSDENLFDADGGLVLKDDAHSEEEHSEESESSEESPEGIELSGEDEASGSPEGLFGDAPAPNIEPLTKNIEPTTNFTKTEPLPFISMNMDVTKELRIADIPPEKKTVAAETPPKKGPRSVEAIMNFGEKTAIDQIPSMDDLEEIPDHEVQFPDKKHISPVVHATSGDFPSAPVKSTMNPQGTVAYFLEKVRKQGKDQFDKDVIASFQHMKTFFKKSILLAIGDKDRLVKPLLWDGAFDGQKPMTSEFSLKTPSIFRVVSGTQKPYHGFVVVNDLNESFFESWNHGQIPDHVTIVPLMDGDHVVGMLMGFGEKASYNKNVLSFTENVAKGLSTKLFKPAPAKVA